jgi:hypothetical protein
VRLRRRAPGVRVAVVMPAAGLVATYAGSTPAAVPGFASVTSAASSASSQTLTIPRPDGVGTAHVLVAAVAFGVETSITAPSGWTEVIRTTCSGSASLTQAIFVRAASADEPDSYLFSVATATGAVGSIAAYSGVDRIQPVDASSGRIAKNSKWIIGTSVATTMPNALLVGAFAHTGRSTVTTPAGMSTRGDATTGADAPSARILTADELRAAAGPTGDRVAQAAVYNACSVAQLVALRPAPDPPSSTSPPVVSGVAQEGNVLTATTGSWTGSQATYAYQWQRSGTDVPGANSADYALTSGDVGHAISVVVIASNSGGEASAASTPTEVVLPAAPVNSAPPTVSGDAVEGQTLTADPGAWSGSPGYGFAWERCDAVGCLVITAADAQTYTLTAEDVGLTVRVVVTASNPGGSASAASEPTPPVQPAGPPAPPSNVDPPAILGTPQVGGPLAATKGTWSGFPTSYAYQWRRSADDGASWTDIDGATGSGYTPGTDDIGLRLGVTVTATNTEGTATATSAPTEPVLAAPPANTSPPVVSGEAVEGSTLLASTGDWLGAASEYGFLWERCDQAGCTGIRFANDADYTLKDDDVGFTVRAVVTALNATGSTSAASSATAVVLPLPPANEEPPTISGIAGQGETLTAAPGDWRSSAPVTYAYQWQRSGDGGVTWTDLPGADSATYVVVADDVGNALRVVVTATNAGGSGSAASAATAGVTPPGAPVNVSSPTVGGVVLEGGRLTARPGTWSGLPTFAYQWQRSSDGGLTWVAIYRARNVRYTLVAADVGRLVRVLVTARNAYGSATAASAAYEIFPAGGGQAIVVNATWLCNTAVDLDLVKVTITDGDHDAIRFDNCSGRVGRVEIDTNGLDGLKVRNIEPVAHDLTIEGGYVRCTGRPEGGSPGRDPGDRRATGDVQESRRLVRRSEQRIRRRRQRVGADRPRGHGGVDSDGHRDRALRDGAGHGERRDDRRLRSLGHPQLGRVPRRDSCPGPGLHRPRRDRPDRRRQREAAGRGSPLLVVRRSGRVG